MLGYIIGLILTFVAWAIWGASMLSNYGQLLITNGGLVGFEAFLAGNLNLFVIFFFIIALFWLSRSGG